MMPEFTGTVIFTLHPRDGTKSCGDMSFCLFAALKRQVGLQTFWYELFKDI